DPTLGSEYIADHKHPTRLPPLRYFATSSERTRVQPRTITRVRSSSAIIRQIVRGLTANIAAASFTRSNPSKPDSPPMSHCVDMTQISQPLELRQDPFCLAFSANSR